MGLRSRHEGAVTPRLSDVEPSPVSGVFMTVCRFEEVVVVVYGECFVRPPLWSDFSD